MSHRTKRPTDRRGPKVLSRAAYLIALFLAGSTAQWTCQAQVSAQGPAKPAVTVSQANAAALPAASLNYDQMVQRAKALASAHPQDALALCKQTIQRDPSRYEAHVVAAAALRQQKQYGRAVAQLQTALALAPENQTPRIRRALTETKVASLRADSRRKLDGLMLILEDAQATKSAADRERFLREFLAKSDAFLNEYPSISDLWSLRAQTAIELGEAKTGWQAGRKLIELGYDRSDVLSNRKLMATLERKGWLGDHAPQTKAEATAKLVSFLRANIALHEKDETSAVEDCRIKLRRNYREEEQKRIVDFTAYIDLAHIAIRVSGAGSACPDCMIELVADSAQQSGVESTRPPINGYISYEYPDGSGSFTPIPGVAWPTFGIVLPNAMLARDGADQFRVTISTCRE
jgi:hypothetical protein